MTAAPDDAALANGAHLGGPGALRDAIVSCRALIAAENWVATLSVIDELDPEAIHPRLLQMEMLAAQQVNDPARFKRIGDAIAKLPSGGKDEARAKLFLIRDLAKAGDGNRAAELYLSHPDLHAQPFAQRVLVHLIRHAGSGTLRRAVVRATAEATGGLLGSEPDTSTFRFEARSYTTRLPKRGLVSASPHVASAHVDGFEAELAQFRSLIERNLARPHKASVGEYRNVFTDRNEQIWVESGAVIRSKGVPIASVRRADVPNIGVAMMAQTKTRGLYHWLVDRVPRFGWLGNPANAADDIPILVSDNAAGFVPDSLSMMGLASRTVPVGDAVFVDRLLVPTVGFVNMAGWSHVDWGLQRLIDDSMAKARAAAVDLPRRIYISRRDAKRRVMTNEVELEALLPARGFEIYEFSKIPLWHQIALVHSADIVLAPHGAGLAHLIAARPTLRVIEILPIKDGTYLLRFNYARLSAIKQLDYRAWLEAQSPSANEWSVDLATFLPFLDDALAN